MTITEVRVKLVRNRDERLRAFCSMTFDHEFVIRDIKVIERANGYFVAMPSRKVGERCERCGGKNHLKARFCNGCGKSLRPKRPGRNPNTEIKLHADIAHPINAECRQRIQEAIIVAYQEELERSRQPGYRPMELNEPDDETSGRIR